MIEIGPNLLNVLKFGIIVGAVVLVIRGVLLFFGILAHAGR